MNDPITRRKSLLTLGGALAGGAWRIATADGEPSGPAALTNGAVKSVLAPELAHTTFMRGIQRTNAKGLAVYPGWYTGRAVHIHLKVHVGGKKGLLSVRRHGRGCIASIAMGVHTS